MTKPYVVVTVDHEPGRQTQYGVALTTNGIDRQPVDHPPFARPKEAQRYADRLQRRIDGGQR
jgi:F420-0:gamma-glutamyl ligase